MKNIIVIAGTSSMGVAYLKAQEGCLGKAVICARNEDLLTVTLDDLKARWPRVEWYGVLAELDRVDQIESTWNDLMSRVKKVDEVLVCLGQLGCQEEDKNDVEKSAQLLHVNSVATSAWTLIIAKTLKQQQHGVLGVITSVAGERGRVSNYIYGSSKAQLMVLLEGLRAELSSEGVRVIDFRPGMVATAMTAHLKKGLLMSEVEPVGRRLKRAMEKEQGVVYSSALWWAIIKTVKCIPFIIFKRLKF